MQNLAKPRKILTASLFGLFLFTSTGAGRAAEILTTLDRLPEVVRKPLLAADGHLRRQEWEQARGLLRVQLAEAVEDAFWQGSFRETLWRLAVAEAGLGLTDDARWHWQAVVSFAPAPTAADLAPYGAAAESLARTPPREEGTPPTGPIDQAPGLTPARRVQGEPLDLRRLQEKSPPLWLQLELVVDADGRVREPAVVEASSSALAYQVLEAVRAWRYEPARRDGKPVASLVTLAVNTPREEALETILTPTGELAAIDALLRAGKWRQAGRKGDDLWSQALHNATQTRQAFALLLAQRALAEAGAGDQELAICRWQAAQGLAPDLFHADLAPFGAAGALLETYRWGYPIRLPGAARPPAPGAEGASKVTPPVARRRAKPEIPRVAMTPGKRGTVVVESIIGKNGAILQPRVRPEDLGTEPNFAASAVDTLCHWQFTPATFEGAPVAVYYSLAVNFLVRE